MTHIRILHPPGRVGHSSYLACHWGPSSPVVLQCGQELGLPIPTFPSSRPFIGRIPTLPPHWRKRQGWPAQASAWIAELLEKKDHGSMWQVVSNPGGLGDRGTHGTCGAALVNFIVGTQIYSGPSLMLIFNLKCFNIRICRHFSYPVRLYIEMGWNMSVEAARRVGTAIAWFHEVGWFRPNWFKPISIIHRYV